MKTAIFKSKTPNYNHPLIKKRAEISDFIFTGEYKEKDWPKIAQDENLQIETAKKLNSENE